MRTGRRLLLAVYLAPRLLAAFARRCGIGGLLLVCACGQSGVSTPESPGDAGAQLDAVTTDADLCLPQPQDGLGLCGVRNTCRPDEVNPLDCTRTGDCTFEFPRDLFEPVNLEEDCVLVPTAAWDPAGGWSLSADGHTVTLRGAACDRIRGRAQIRLVLTFIHSCIL